MLSKIKNIRYQDDDLKILDFLLEKLKDRLRISHDDHDNLLKDILKSSVGEVQSYLGKSIFEQEIECNFVVNTCPVRIDLPILYAREITKCVYLDYTNCEKEVDIRDKSKIDISADNEAVMIKNVFGKICMTYKARLFEDKETALCGVMGEILERAGNVFDGVENKPISFNLLSQRKVNI